MGTQAGEPRWAEDELAALGEAEEIDIAPMREDGSLGGRVTIWVVPHDGDLYIRSWKGRTAAWFRGVETRHEARIWAGDLERDVRLEPADRGVEDALDAVYRSKYRAHGATYVDDMVGPVARDTTMRLVPRR